MPKSPSPRERTTLQSLIWPEQGVCTERDLYLRLKSAVGFSEGQKSLYFTRAGQASFDTWFNLFNIGKWRRECNLSDLHLLLEGTGSFEVVVRLAVPDRSWERLVNEVVHIEADSPVSLDIGPMFDLPVQEGVLFFELKSLGDGMLTNAHWQTENAPRRKPELMLAVTTFQRETEVQHTAERFEDWVANNPLRDNIRLTVVDNGQSVQIAESNQITVVPNENLGGAGGFARGLLAARDTGASHCLFMDDDACIHMDSISRTYWFLAYATNANTAVAGAMINSTYRWAIWENGAVFNTRCIPQHMGVDLREVDESFDMEFATTGPPPDNFYGGWWFFAFPVAQATHMPFPFFVRGDDVSFSLAHDFNIVTLNGVVSFQDSFTDKESPLTWYLDLRSHMAHHLSLQSMQVGALQTLKIAVWFYLRNLPRLHYETIAAINLALEDVIQGPAFFDKNADVAGRRADINALTHQEMWRPAPRELPVDNIRFNPKNPLVRWFMKLTLNGHLLPFFSLYGNRVVIEAPDRGQLRCVWGASQLTYLSVNKQQCYTVRHSKRQMAKETVRFCSLALRFLKRYGEIQSMWSEGYGTLTTDSYWRQKLRAPAE